MLLQVETFKRACLHSLPPTLVLHLKRFELNYDTFTKQKVNTRCEFPQVCAGLKSQWSLVVDPSFPQSVF